MIKCGSIGGMLLRTAPRAVAAVLTTCLLALFCVLAVGCSGPPAAPAAHASSLSGGAAVPRWAAGHQVVRPAELPPEARTTLALIDKGGPYPYARDGVVFGNVEKELPSHTRGYYHEYTVPTPGSADRGARRLVTGRNAETFYTDDHYASFQAVLR